MQTESFVICKANFTLYIGLQFNLKRILRCSSVAQRYLKNIYTVLSFDIIRSSFLFHKFLYVWLSQ